jgi:ABC-type transport system involved in cytochrome c biogenesis permease component
MRHLARKDLQILRRSPLLVSLLVIYPLVVAVLIGLALSRGPDKPKVAFLNEVPPGQETFTLGGQQIDASKYADRLFTSVEPIRVSSRAEAEEKVRSGEALAALIVPADITRKLSSGLEQPQLEVIYNARDPVKARFVEATIKARLADANAALSRRFTAVAGDYLDLLLRGGSLTLFGRQLDVLGLANAKKIVDGTIAGMPADDPNRRALEQVSRFGKLAIDNLDLTDEVLRSVGEPVAVKRTTLAGRHTPLDAFAVAVAATVSLMFVTVFLAAGLLALEREEHAYGRLVRGLVSRGALLTEKAGLAALCALVVSLLLVAGIGAFVALDWGNAPLWVAALAGGGIAFAALGVAIGALAREVRAATLLALLLSLPLAFLALVPSGAVADGLYDVIRAVSALFPFRPALDAMTAALDGAGEDLLAPLLHLAALALGFGVLARLGLRRFA